ncbi:MAG: bifunctional diaminohydroxyphosphoribosylaminopyrimidine deaminase/5-amino-6-(5-phosphoribosylamino)uracil reductase RibD [Candidatus Baltobacteraceae bacterium]
MSLAPADRVYLERTYALARRALGNISPNPPVGAVVVADGRIVGEGYHHRAGEAHAEVLALAAAGERARGAVLYVSLEPCNHHGRTPPCTHALAQADITRVVAGTRDPDPRTAGAGFAYLREHGVAAQDAHDPQARDLIAPFARAIQSQRPFVTLKMAMSLDGFAAAGPGVQTWLTGEEARAFVRELRIEHDAAGIGAGTVQADDPQLTVRPARRRAVPYARVVFCGTEPPQRDRRIFAEQPGYAKTIVLASGANRKTVDTLGPAADVLFVGETPQLDLNLALDALYARGIMSLLCEGGPALAGSFLRLGLVDRLVWLIAPRFLHSPHAVPVVSGGTLAETRGLRVTSVERLGGDMMMTGMFERV